MRPFDFVITFISFIFALALTHLLLAVTHMIRHRREIVFDLAHALWMLDALMLLILNWISFWDFHAINPLPLATIAVGFVYSVNQYLVCALVSPKLDGADGLDMHAFQEKQGKTYIGAFAVLIGFSIAANYFSGSDMNIQNWARENVLVIPMLPIVLAPLVARARWVQIAAPIAFLVLMLAYLVMFYPALR